MTARDRWTLRQSIIPLSEVSGVGAGNVCEACGAPLPARRGPGRPRLYCAEHATVTARNQMDPQLVSARTPKPPRPPKQCRRCGAELEDRRRWYCDSCREVVNEHRRSTRAGRAPARSSTERGYGGRHKALRRRWALIVEAGYAICARCGRPIIPGTAWDLGHVDADRSQYAGPEHRRCNRATASHKAQRRGRAW
jgi:hypothetical protein